jgi:hypothetical protein
MQVRLGNASPARTSILLSSVMPVRLGHLYACRRCSIHEGGSFIPFTGDDVVCGSEAVQRKSAKRGVPLFFLSEHAGVAACLPCGSLAKAVPAVEICRARRWRVRASRRVVTLRGKQSPWKLFAQFSLSRERDVANITPW